MLLIREGCGITHSQGPLHGATIRRSRLASVHAFPAAARASRAPFHPDQTTMARRPRSP